MNLSPAQKKIREKEKEKARFLYGQGLTTREVGKMMNKSRSWVSVVTRGLWWRVEAGEKILIKDKGITPLDKIIRSA